MHCFVVHVTTANIGGELNSHTFADVAVQLCLSAQISFLRSVG